MKTFLQRVASLWQMSNESNWGGYESLRGWVETTAAGVSVTKHSAVRLTAVSRCVQLLSATMATLPKHVFLRESDAQKTRRHDHPVERLVNEVPNPTMSAVAFWTAFFEAMLLKGDGMAWVVRTGPTPTAIVLLDPDAVTVLAHPEDRFRRIYRIVLDDGLVVTADQDDIVHVPWFGYDGYRSLPPLRYVLRDAAALGLASQEFTQRFFGNGAQPSVSLEAPGRVNEEQAKLMAAQFAERNQGLSKSHLPLVLTQGVKANKLTHNAQESQLIELRSFQVVDICRAFGVPPHMVGETTNASSFGTGIEQMSRGFSLYTLRPIIVALEQEIKRKLMQRSKFFLRIKVDALVRGDQKARAEYYTAALGGSGGPAWMTPNEVRALEDLPPDPNGNELVTWTRNDDASPIITSS